MRNAHTFRWLLASMVALGVAIGCASRGAGDGRGAGGTSGSGDAGSSGEAGSGDAGNSGSGGNGGNAGGGGDGSLAPPSIDDLPSCDTKEPDLACVEQLFLPLEGGAWPFDAEHATRAFAGNRLYVAADWQATAVHVLEAESLFPFACHFDSFQYATDVSSPPSGPSCGRYLAFGGHPRVLECKEEGVFLGECVDQVPLDEVFDIAIVEAAEPSDAYFTVLADAPSVGERVFLVGQPGFPWLSDDDHAKLLPRYPLVSSGVVLAVEGEAIVVSNLAFPGSSGGVLLNARGRALGVASTLIGHMRAQGTSIPEDLADHRTVIVGFTQTMSDLLESVNEP